MLTKPSNLALREFDECLELLPTLKTTPRLLFVCFLIEQAETWSFSRFLHRDPKWHASVGIVHRQINRYIDNAFTQINMEKGQNETRDVQATPRRYILLHEMAKQTQDRLDLRSQILAVFMPGRDSTGFALSNVFHVLARRPDIYQKLRAEVLEHAPAWEPLTFELLKSMKYTQWVINEGATWTKKLFLPSTIMLIHIIFRPPSPPNHCSSTTSLSTGYHTSERRRRQGSLTNLRPQR